MVYSYLIAFTEIRMIQEIKFELKSIQYELIANYGDAIVSDDIKRVFEKLTSKEVLEPIVEKEILKAIELLAVDEIQAAARRKYHEEGKPLCYTTEG